MTASESTPAAADARVRPLSWLASYQPRWLAADCLAGVTLAAYAVPVALAYATLAGLPPEVGIYGYLLGGIGYVAVFSLANFVKYQPREIVVTIPPDKFLKKP